MKKQQLLLFVTALLFGVTHVSAQNLFGSNQSGLRGIWQMCFYLAESPDVPGNIKPGNTFKILTDDNRIVNFTVIPNKGSIITGYGSYEIVDDKTYVEHIERNIHLPMLDGRENVMLYELVDNDQLMKVKFLIEKDENGNEINSWYNETWKKIDMPDKFPEDLVR
ncbi:MAG: DUF4488 domain-containing protein [Bacteroides sp.]|nr:DUF4488 domain-containing protein [Bacteroides sp.]